MREELCQKTIQKYLVTPESLFSICKTFWAQFNQWRYVGTWTGDGSQSAPK